MNSIADVVDGQVPRSWHEAVAVVQEVAAQLSPGLSPPDPQDVLLDDEGMLTLGFGSESPDEPVVQLAKLLQLVLDGTDAPAPLVELVQENTRVPPAHTSIGSFSRALAFFERPNRASDIAALAGRLNGRRPVPLRNSLPDANLEVSEGKEEAVDRNLERLKDKIAHAEKVQAATPQRLASMARNWARPAAVASLVILVALAAGAWLSGRSASPAVGLSNAVESAETKLADVLSKSIDRMGGIEPAAAATRTDSAVEKPARDINVPKRDSGGRPSRAQAAPPSGSGARLAKPGGIPRPVGSSGLPSLELSPDAEIEPSSPVVVPVDLTRVYSSADSGVEPATLRRPQLPSRPDPDATTGYFDIIVNELGQVDEVRLISPTRRYYDRMMVAAAKAWVFQPARLNGRPVKYRTRIPIIGPPPM